MMRLAAILLLLLHASAGFCQTLVKQSYGTNTNLRGLSVAGDGVAWTSGSNGWVGRTTDAGTIWHWQQIKGYEKFDFRDIEAFSAEEALVVNAGSPAVILKTVDGGKSWKKVYSNSSPDIFLDGMSFSDRMNGIVFGDPINHKLQILRTGDGGESWEDISVNLTEPMFEGEASFAASGTTIRTVGKNVWIATGGTRSRLISSTDFGQTWKIYDCPIIQGRSSTGIFSIEVISPRKIYAVGGDYLSDSLRTQNMVYSRNGGKKWQFPQRAPFGYRSSVSIVGMNTLFAAGPSGTDISHNRGKTWNLFSLHGFNAIAKDASGKFILLAGSNGDIYKLEL